MNDAVARTERAQSLRQELERARSRTLALLDLSEADQRDQHSPLMSPMVWDLAHIGNFEELWLLRGVDDRPAIDERLDDLYNAFEHPRWERPSLPLLGPDEARSYIARVRADALEVLDDLDLDGDRRLTHDGRVHHMVIQHEHQHDETLVATRQLMGERASPPPGAGRRSRPGGSVPVSEVLMDGGEFVLGSADDPRSYDNERPAHEVQVAPFWLDTTPVTNLAYAGFIAAGGYDDQAHWSEAGWAWRVAEQADMPQFWRPADTASEVPFEILRFGSWAAAVADEPVQHVSWYEAEAFCWWAGRRLLTETEWEYAATVDRAGKKSQNPWGDGPATDDRANLSQRHSGPAPVGAYPDGASDRGVHQLMGDVWEWTSSRFDGYPGFEAFPYREYSEVFFPAGPPGREMADNGGFRVLRGGSWATDAAAVRATFRNWDHPIRRQIFAGFRTARDA